MKTHVRTPALGVLGDRSSVIDSRLIPLTTRSCAVLRQWRRWSLAVTVLVAAMVPWYTLREFPILTIGSAKVNPLDALVACTALFALPCVVRGLLTRLPLAFWIGGFMVSVAVSFMIGLSTADSTFFALREARALAFFAVALAFVTGDFEADDFRWFARAYAIGATIAAVAVFAHVHWRTPLPGYGNIILYQIANIALSQPGLARGMMSVQYLVWAVPVVSLMLILIEMVRAKSYLERISWALACIVIVWYILATAERFLQVVALVVAVGVPLLSFRARERMRGFAAVAVVLTIVGLLAVAGLQHASWVGPWVRYTVLRWSGTLSDESLTYRVRELTAGLPLMARDPLFGQGLGGVIPIPGPGQPVTSSNPQWHYISSGYGFLLLRTGMLGFGLFVGTVVTALRLGWRRLRVVDIPQSLWSTTAVGVAGVTVLLVLNLLDPVVDVPEDVIALGMFLGMTVASSRDCRK